MIRTLAQLTNPNYRERVGLAGPAPIFHLERPAHWGIHIDEEVDPGDPTRPYIISVGESGMHVSKDELVSLAWDVAAHFTAGGDSPDFRNPDGILDEAACDMAITSASDVSVIGLYIRYGLNIMRRVYGEVEAQVRATVAAEIRAALESEQMQPVGVFTSDSMLGIARAGLEKAARIAESTGADRA